MVESLFKPLYPATLDLAKRPHALTSNKSIHPLGGSRTKLRFLALPGSNIRPWLPLEANLRSDLPSRGGELARWVLRLNNRAAFLKHLVVHHQQNAGDWGIQFSRSNHPCCSMSEVGVLLQLGNSASKYVVEKRDCTRAGAAMLLDHFLRVLFFFTPCFHPETLPFLGP